MLPDHMIELLTAYVDGELSQSQRDEVMRLLNKSAEARDLLRQLQENAHKVKQLPRRKVEPSLVDEIVQAISERRAVPKPITTTRRGRRLLHYVAATMAASIFLGVIGILYWQASVYNRDLKKNELPPVANNTDKKPEPKPGPEPVVPTPKKTNPLLAQMTEAIVRDFGAPLPPEMVFTAAFADLKKDGKASAQLVHEVSREKSVQLEVVVKKNSDAMARLREVLKGQGIKLVADPATNKAVDDKKVEYLVYAENLTTGELAKLMSELSESYVLPGTNGMNQKNVPSPYQKVKLTPLAKDEKQKVAKLLGVDAGTLERKEGKPETKLERSVLLLPSTGSAKQSAEVRQFVNQRRTPPAGAVQILIKIRQE